MSTPRAFDIGDDDLTPRDMRGVLVETKKFVIANIGDAVDEAVDAVTEGMPAGIARAQTTADAAQASAAAALADRVRVIDGELYAPDGETPIPVVSESDLAEAVTPKIDSAQAVLRDRALLNVKDFGACGDGIVDDTDAVQAAIDACGAAGGGTVYFPRGTYLGDTAKSVSGYIWIWSVTSSRVNLDFTDGAALRTTKDARLLFISGAGRPAGATGWRSYWIGDPTKATYRPMSPAARGDRSITVTTPAHASGFAPGDFVHIRTGQLINSGIGTTEPDAEINQVVSANATSGQIVLRWPLAKPYAQEYFIAGTTGKTSTTVTANPATFGVAKITDRTVEDVSVDGLTFDAPNCTSSVVDAIGAVVGLRISGLRGTCAGNVVNNIEVRGFRANDWRVRSHTNVPGSYRWAFAFGTSCTDGKVEDVEAVGTGARMLVLHIHEGSADVEVVRSRLVTTAGTDDMTPVSIRARAYNVRLRDVRVESAGTQSPVSVSAECSGGGVLDTVSATCADAAKGISVQAPGWKIVAPDAQTPVRQSGAARNPGVPSAAPVWLTGILRHDSPTLVLGTLPPNTIVLWQMISISVDAPFDDTGTDRLTLGWDSIPNAVLSSAAALDLGTVGRKEVTSASGALSAFAGTRNNTERALKVFYTGQNGNATAGKATIAVPYIVVPELS